MPRMSDEEFVYWQDIKEKKQAGRGAFHKKCGSKSKKCNFPSDYMTKKEKMAMNGPVMSYDPNKFYEWAEFKQLPMEYQIKYVNSLLNRYNCGLSNISVDVFGLSPSGLISHFRKANQLQFINKPSRHSSSGLRKGGINLKADVEATRNPQPVNEIQNGSETGNGEAMNSETGNGEAMNSETGNGEAMNSESGNGEAMNSESGNGEAMNSKPDDVDELEEPKELTLQEKIDQAAETVKLYESRGLEMTPDLINKIYIEKTGMDFILANYIAGMNAEIEDYRKSIGKAKESEDEGMKLLDEDPQKLKDSTDVKSFSIVMDHIDMDIIQYVSDLFKGKKIAVALEVKEVL